MGLHLGRVGGEHREGVLKAACELIFEERLSPAELGSKNYPRQGGKCERK